MGIQQSKNFDTDDYAKIPDDAILHKIVLRGNTKSETTDSMNLTHIITDQNDRLTTGILNIRMRDRILYLYLKKNDSSSKLVKTINFNNSDISVNAECLFSSISISDKYVGIPETDPDDGIIFSIYVLNDILVNSRMRSIRTSEFDSRVSANRLIGDYLHQIFMNDGMKSNNQITIRSLELKSGSRKTLIINEPIEKLRFSITGETIGTFGNGILTEYVNISDNKYINHTSILTDSTRFNLIDFIVTDHNTVYYIMIDNESNKKTLVYHVVNFIKPFQNRIITKIDNFNSPIKLHQIDAREYTDLFVPDLDFFTSNNELVHIRDLIVIVSLLDQKIEMRILAEMVRRVGNVDDISILELSTNKYEFDSKFKLSRIGNELMFLENSDRVITHVYDLKKIIGVHVSNGLANLLRDQTRHQIKTEIVKARELLRKMGNTDSPSSIIIRAADERDVTYDIKSIISQYSVLISTLYDRIDKIDRIDGKYIIIDGTDVPIYQVTVNSNMTLMDIRSLEVFESLLDGETTTSSIVDKIFMYYPESSYDRYQTINEILDHIYDYTKFILLDIDLKPNEILDQIFALYKKRVALLVAYICASIVMDYYNRETDLSHCLKQIKGSPDYEITTGIVDSFYQNFQPFKKIMDYHMCLLGYSICKNN